MDYLPDPRLTLRKLLLYLHDHANELRQGPGLHFLHHPGAVNFDCALTDVQVSRYDFIGFALDDKLHDLLFSRRQFFDPFLDFLLFEVAHDVLHHRMVRRFPYLDRQNLRLDKAK